ncbi:MAG TPA: site-specific integrase [Ktedonobacterales bacterium]|nr:site-specific integrase [Ktedonobacterales bacterium]
MENGQRKAYYGKTRAEVQQTLTTALHDRDRGLPITSDRLTLGQYLVGWLDASRHQLKPRSWQRYEEITRRHIAPTLGKLPLRKVTPQDVQRLYAAKLDEELSTTTVHYVHRTLRRALGEAERQGMVPRNVARLVTPPRPQRDEMHALDSDQVRRFLGEAVGHRLEAFFTLAIHSGARVGELLALRWKDVSLDRACLSVQATLQRTREGGFTFASPKSARSRRQITLSPTAIVALRRHRAHQLEERLAAGDAWQDNDLVFADILGAPLDGTHVLRYQFAPLLKRAGLPPMRLHDLRHTCATLLLGQGINPKIVSEMLGHSTVAITLDLYSHVLPTMQQSAASALEAAIGTR